MKSYVTIALAVIGLIAIVNWAMGSGRPPIPVDPPQNDPQYVCPDGRVVSNPADCPVQVAPTNPPPGQTPTVNPPPQQDMAYEVAHGDILEDGECHIRVSGPNQSVVVNSSGDYNIRKVFASSPEDLSNQVENIRQGAANHAGMACPDG